MKLSRAAIVLTVLGCATLFACDDSTPRYEAGPAFEADDAEVERHWKIVRDYRDAIRNPANYEHDPQSGLSSMSVPDISVSLAYLVAAGEIVHADVVVPEVPRSRTAVKHWLAWAQDRNDIWEMTGQYGTPFEVRGELPLHLNIWYDESAHDDIQELIRELEALPKEGT
jgi:hypothetical protein